MPLRLLYLIIISSIISVSSAQDIAPDPRFPLPETSYEGERITLDLYFDAVQQGRVGLFRITSDDDLTGITATAFARTLPVFERGGDFYGLISVNMEQAPRRYELVVVATFDDQATERITAPIDINDGGFIQQPVVMPPDLVDLLDREIEDNELERLFATARPITDIALWDENGFTYPIRAELTSPFGAVRVFNDTYPSVHTGWDFNAQIGEPLLAVADGEVVLADLLPIRGNHVMVNHGVGVYSGYSHLSVVYVTQGQSVSAGQVIGLVGSTGRSSSAHAHIEFIVDSNWIDASDFIQMTLP